MNLLNQVGFGDAQQIIASLQVMGMSGKLPSAIAGLIQVIALNHRPHRAVNDDDPLAKELSELCAVTLHRDCSLYPTNALYVCWKGVVSLYLDKRRPGKVRARDDEI